MRTVAIACAVVLCSQPSASTEARQACVPVPHARLEALLPVLPRFTRDRPKSETDPLEAVSRTTVDYEARAAVISIELMDSCRNSDMLSQLREFLAQGPPATAGTVMRSLPILGFPAYTEWTQASGHGEVHVLVADRFMVKVTGDLVGSLAVVEGAAKAIDLQRLAALK